VSNPASGGGRGARDRERIARLLKDAGVNFELVSSEYRGHALELVEAAARAGRRHFLAIGGDGTLNEAVNGALAGGATSAGEATFGLVPVGRATTGALSIRPLSGCCGGACAAGQSRTTASRSS
jgi:diacylglycerol kinase family enzyme